MRIGLKLREQVKQHGVKNAGLILREAIEQKKIRIADISLREMAESMIGENWDQHLRACTGNVRLRESIDAVDASGFSAITGQLLIDTVREKYKLATFVGDQLFTTNKISNNNLGPQREPYLSDTTDDPGLVQQGMDYPQTAFVGQYVDYPAPQKYGRICSVTFEMIYSDLTGQAFDSASSVGRRVGLWVEKMRLRVALGIVNNHSWNGTVYNTYQSNGTWNNLLSSFNVTNWTSVNQVEQMFALMLDPVLLEPIDIEDGMVALCMPENFYNLKRIFSATETRSGNEASDTGSLTVAPNPLDNYTAIKSKHARKMLTSEAGYTPDVSDTVTIWGNPKKAFLWREVFPMQVIQAPPQNSREFYADIVLQVKANVYGVACVRDPRYVALAYNSSQA